MADVTFFSKFSGASGKSSSKSSWEKDDDKKSSKSSKDKDDDKKSSKSSWDKDDDKKSSKSSKDKDGDKKSHKSSWDKDDDKKSHKSSWDKDDDKKSHKSSKDKDDDKSPWWKSWKDDDDKDGKGGKDDDKKPWWKSWKDDDDDKGSKDDDDKGSKDDDDKGSKDDDDKGSKDDDDKGSKDDDDKDCGCKDDEEEDCAFIVAKCGVKVKVSLAAQPDGSMKFNVEVLDEGKYIGDLRGLFFQIADETKLAGMTVTGADVTDSQFAANAVTDLGNGANVSGLGQKFDGGIEFGTAGIGADDLREVSFTLTSPKGLTYDDFEMQDFALRLTSVGPECGPRCWSVKMLGNAGELNCEEPALAGLGDFVWLDVNGDGQQGADELGIAGVTVNLYTGAGVFVDTTVTAGAGDPGGLGYYEFTDLIPGDYYVEFVAPAGLEFTTPNSGDDATDSDAVTGGDPTVGQSQTVTLAAGEFNPTLDAGLVEALAGLGDFVWLDEDLDGQQGDTELGVAGVRVNLFTGAGVFLAFTTTAADGSYAFTDLTPGDYYVTFEAPDGFAFTLPNIGDDVTDSDAVPDFLDPTVGQSQTVTLAAGEFNPTLDAGLIEQPQSTQGVIIGRIFCDKDESQTDTPGDTAIVGRTVVLTGAGLDGAFGTDDDTTQSTVTDDTGGYVFEFLEPGLYTVDFQVQGLVTQDVGGDDTVDSDANPATGTTAVIEIPDTGGSVVIEDVDAGVICYKLSDEGLLGITGAIDTSGAQPFAIVLNDKKVGTSYDAVADVLTINTNIGLQFFLSPTLPAPVRLEIVVGVDQNGDLTGVGSGPEFFLWNDVDNDGIREDGEEVYLEGDVILFGSQNGFPGSSFLMDFAILTTGGTRQSDFPDLVGLDINAEFANAPNGFEQSFETENAKGLVFGNLAYECLC